MLLGVEAATRDKQLTVVVDKHRRVQDGLNKIIHYHL